MCGRPLVIIEARRMLMYNISCDGISVTCIIILAKHLKVIGILTRMHDRAN